MLWLGLSDLVVPTREAEGQVVLWCFTPEVESGPFLSTVPVEVTLHGDKSTWTAHRLRAGGSCCVPVMVGTQTLPLQGTTGVIP